MVRYGANVDACGRRDGGRTRRARARGVVAARAGRRGDQGLRRRDARSRRRAPSSRRTRATTCCDLQPGAAVTQTVVLHNDNDHPIDVRVDGIDGFTSDATGASYNTPYQKPQGHRPVDRRVDARDHAAAGRGAQRRLHGAGAARRRSRASTSAGSGMYVPLDSRQHDGRRPPTVRRRSGSRCRASASSRWRSSFPGRPRPISR